MFLTDYIVGIAISLGMRCAALFNKKAQRILQGRQETVPRLKARLNPERPTVWMHAASLGEFEQGRPLIEGIRTSHPEWQIVVSFFSPSGYEVRHDYTGADCVVYLPNDTPWAVQHFLDAARPDRAIFVKYDYWPVMLSALKGRRIPTYLVSAIFQPRQHFFKPWGCWYRQLLHHFDYLWVQDEASVDLLHQYGIHHCAVAGDTRFDRAMAIAKNSCLVPEVESLKQRLPNLIVAGSTWPTDDEALISFANEREDVGLVIAPHEIDEAHLKSIETRAKRPIARLSALRSGAHIPYDYLLIDNFGLLASLYRYASIAYIGGGFGRGLHNSVEAAVYGLPLVYGPRIERFREAQLFVQKKIAEVADTPSEVADIFDRLLSDIDERAERARRAHALVNTQLGATELILNQLGFSPQHTLSHDEKR